MSIVFKASQIHYWSLGKAFNFTKIQFNFSKMILEFFQQKRLQNFGKFRPLVRHQFFCSKLHIKQHFFTFSSLYLFFTFLKKTHFHLEQEDFYKKRIVSKNLVKIIWKDFNKVMWNSTYTHKRIISASMKTLQIKLLFFSAAK